MRNLEANPVSSGEFFRYRTAREKMIQLVRKVYGDCGLDSQENQVNFELAKERLKEGALVVATNHFTADDALLALYTTIYGLEDEINTLAAVTARKQHDYRRNPLNAFFLNKAGWIGAETIVVVQHNDLRSYSHEERRALLRHTSARIGAVLSQPGGVLIIAPEATRSENMALQPSQRLIDHFNQNDRQVSFLPIGIEPDEKAKRGFNLGQHFTIQAGQPFTAAEVEEEFTHLGYDGEISFRHQLMMKVAELLPRKMWGFYESCLDDYSKRVEAASFEPILI